MASSKPTEIGSSKMFEGFNKRYKHHSSTLGCSMNFHIYFPPSTSPDQRFPVLYWLSGLTCNDENFIIKSGAQRVASTEGIALIVPDTSPRGLNVEGEADSYDFGVGAGFYLNATVEKWKNWQMYDYIVKELPKVLSDNFPQLDTSRASISGHSMGGHGALTICLKKLDKYKSVSAFAPIVNPINCPWGQKAFTNYLGDDKTAWEEYDATSLIKKFNDVGATIMIDQGDDDKFLHENQLLPSKFDEACRNVKAPLLLRMQPDLLLTNPRRVVRLDQVRRMNLFVHGRAGGHSTQKRSEKLWTTDENNTDPHKREQHTCTEEALQALKKKKKS
ncbi:hypothetical protein L2E82_22924 [Cichorium intybus]|uniref:Uncharacterized protein n=1 Tax=Cichorium intybus TaxID=13427 RepID=A0ACB9DZT1_CICIN|nr:hypothetical protein L2E82_22924 [Cichorium intybus]